MIEAIWLPEFGLIALRIVLDLALIALSFWLVKKLFGFIEKVMNVRIIVRIEKKTARRSK